MTFRFKRKESMSAGIKRILAETITDAERSLSKRHENLPQAVHEARKCCKQIRAIYRLIGPEIGEVYKRENKRFRSSAQMLAAARDADVAIESYDALLDYFKERIPSRRPYSQIRRQLTLQRNASLGSLNQLEDQVVEVEKQLAEAKLVVNELLWTSEEFKSLEKGLKKNYWQAYETMHKALENRQGMHFHNWRKYAKYHWYYVRLLRNINPQIMRSQADQLYLLTEVLGQQHDLCELQRHTENNRDKFGPSTDIQGFLDLISARKEELEAQAQAIGTQLFARKPNQVTKPMRAQWQAWRSKNRTAIKKKMKSKKGKK